MQSAKDLPRPARLLNSRTFSLEPTVFHETTRNDFEEKLSRIDRRECSDEAGEATDVDKIGHSTGRIPTVLSGRPNFGGSAPIFVAQPPIRDVAVGATNRLPANRARASQTPIGTPNNVARGHIERFEHQVE